MSIRVNLAANSWTITKDVQQLYDGQFYYQRYYSSPPLPGDLQHIRINVSDNLSSPGTSGAYVDDIRVATVPEPCTTSLVCMALREPAAISLPPSRARSSSA